MMHSSSDDLPRLDGVSILVVDDSPEVLEVVTDALRRGGATVTPVSTAAAAFEELKRARPHVLVSDLEMPGKDGYWLIGQVRGLPPERGGTTPAAALTGLTGPEERGRVLRAGFQYHLEKPLNMTRLVGVASILALKSSRGSEVAKASLMEHPSWMEYLSDVDGIHVLVADNSADVRAQVTRILEERGATVTAVASADEALERVQTEHPHVLVSGLAMPGKGGYWLIDKIRALPPDCGGGIPAAALTACTGPENRAHILRAGFQYHIEKPIDPRILVGVVSILALKE